MSDLVRRTGSRAVDQARSSGSARVAASASVDSSTWDGGSLDFSDMGAVKPSVMGRELHSAVVNEGVVRRRRTANGDRYHRRRMGWVSTTEGLAIVHAEQPLYPDPQGRMHPAGPFGVERTEHVGIMARPTRRVGDVPDGAARTPAGGGEGSTGPAKPKGFARDAPFAPVKVREGLVSLIPAPTLQAAVALSWDGGRRHSVSLLVMDGQRAVAVECSRLKGASHWQVEQLTYDLRPGTEAIGATSRRGQING